MYHLLNISMVSYLSNSLSHLTLNIITGDIRRGFNESKPYHSSLKIAFDLTAAFDTVYHNVLLREILGASNPHSAKRRCKEFSLRSSIEY